MNMVKHYAAANLRALGSCTTGCRKAMSGTEKEKREELMRKEA